MELLPIIIFGICCILLIINEIYYIYKLETPVLSLHGWFSILNRLIIYILFITVIILVDLPMLLLIYPTIQSLTALLEFGWMIYILFAKWLDQRREFDLINGNMNNVSDDVL